MIGNDDTGKDETELESVWRILVLTVDEKKTE